MAELQLKVLLANREKLFNRMQILFELSQTVISNTSQINLFESRYARIDDTYADFETVQDKIMTLQLQLEPNKAIDAKSTIAFEELYYRVKAVAKTVFATAPPSQAPSHIVGAHLPKIEIPKYDGILKNWKVFYDTFRSLIHDNHALSQIEKFHHLLSALSGPPLSIAKSLPLTELNYKIVWETLVSKYENKRIMAGELLDSMLSFKPMNYESLMCFNNFLENFYDSAVSLKALNIPDLQDFILFHVAFRVLPCETRKQFESMHIETEIPSFELLVNFIRNQVQILELSKQPSNALSSKQSNIPRNNYSDPKANIKRAFVTSSNTNSKSCPSCKKYHSIYKCPEFSSMSPADRRLKVKVSRLCFNCLKESHSQNECSSKTNCFHCNRRHHSLLHVFHNEESRADITAHSISCNSKQNQLQTVLLGTVMLKIRDFEGNYHTIRALIDSGAQTSFMTFSCAQKLGLNLQKCNLSIAGLGHSPYVSTKGMSSCILKPRQTENPQFNVNVVVITKITAEMPSLEVPTSVYDQFKDLELADPTFHRPAKIDLLLGAEIFPELFDGKRFQPSSDAPWALGSAFGWIITGKLNPHQDATLPVQNALFVSTKTELLDNLITRLWDLEQVPSKNFVDPDHTACENIYLNNYTRTESGRFIVPLPLKPLPDYNFGVTYNHALLRLYSLERRLNKNPQLKLEYTQFLQDYEKLSHMKLNTGVDVSKDYFIPHHCITKESSSSTKLRVVFDASSRLPQCNSLNDVLYTGPKLQRDLVEVVINFRLHRYVFSADICKMYRQILVKKDHQYLQNILWRENSWEPVKAYTLKTVTYGVSSAPYLAIRSLHQLARDDKGKFPLAAQVLLKDTYVDDIMTGASSLEDAISLRNQLTELLLTGGFDLRKWTANHPEILKDIPEDDRELSFSIDTNSEQTYNLLGIQWEAVSDTFTYRVFSFSKTCTKRAVLSNIARVFDPLGWLTPVIFKAKYFLQMLWKAQLGWDEMFPNELHHEWLSFLNEYEYLRHVKIDRFVNVQNNTRNYLVGFCDASERGYCAVIYLVVCNFEGVVEKINLIIAKSRVAPLKIVSIPRLELCGALLLSRLFKYLFSCLTELILIENTFAFTDSTTVLAWLRTPTHVLKIFVANRVDNIIENAPDTGWHHVISEENPADCGSRGLTASQILEHPLWWSGPSWLAQKVTDWQLSQKWDVPDSSKLELKVVEEVKCFVSQADSNVKFIEKYSSLIRLQRITAWCMRFIDNCRVKTNERKLGLLNAADVKNAMSKLVYVEQQEYFRKEIEILSKGSSTKSTLKNLCLWIDPSGLLRVGGRLKHSNLSEDAKYPFLLSKVGCLAKLIIDHFHGMYLHAGPRSLQAIISRNYWIIGIRNCIRSRLSKCIVCQRFKAKPLYPIMAHLPSQRVTQARPFINVGCDFGGPFLIKEGKRRNAKVSKCYLALFVCMTTKAVHLEVVSDLTSDAFLAALDRFIARRGICNNIYSDCGTNFTGANKYLSEVFGFLSSQQNNASIANALCKQNISWHFNPPYAPHFGGLWEAGIRSAKYYLKRVVKDQALTFEELTTLFTRIEAIMNSRPICELSPNVNEYDALTPGHFLIGAPLIAAPEYDFSELPDNRLNRWQLLKKMYAHFWSRWSLEYLHTLQQRVKWCTHSENIKENDLVAIMEKNLSPMQWKLGRIKRVLPGNDNIVRVVSVQSADGERIRPVVKLCPLILN